MPCISSVWHHDPNPSLWLRLQVFWKVSEAGSTDRGQSDVPNWVTFYGFTGDATLVTQPVNRNLRKLLFLGDSFTYGAGTMVRWIDSREHHTRPPRGVCWISRGAETCAGTRGGGGLAGHGVLHHVMACDRT